MEELQLLKKFYLNNISMWNPNTNYLTYMEHFKKILNYCFDNKISELTYEEWLNILNTNSDHSTIGGETHNICEGLNVIESNRIYRTTENSSNLIISIPKDLLYQFYMENRELGEKCWKIIQERYFSFLNKNNIFSLQGKNHVQRVCLNLYICYLIDTKKYTPNDLKDYVKFAQENGVNIIDKINKVYSYDVCKSNANILEKLKISSNGIQLENADVFKNAILNSLKDTDLTKYNNYNSELNGYNMIYYGIPGCGKSYLVNRDFNEQEYMVFRTTFHPEYSNSDFVGQIIPKTEGDEIKYKFQEGPFSIALLNALKNPNKKVCLIIEEINRGNASAIFGDIFQLLDRKHDGSSIYSIINEPIRKYLNDNGINVNKITIPSNLWIIATMNTNDQNVFTLDTAFKRRWRMHRIINRFKDEDYDKKLAKMYIPGSSYNWEQFITAINEQILHKNPTGLNSEDKQLGIYFVTENELSVEPVNSDIEIIDKFIEKVLLYIWDDVAKVDPNLWFNDEIECFDDLVSEYHDKKLNVFKEIFKDQVDIIQSDREENEKDFEVA